MSTSILPRQKKFARKLYDVLLFSTVAVVFILSCVGVIYPHNTYIQCNDPYISHGYFDDTISVAVLLLVSLLVPFFVMVIGEWNNFYHRPIPNPINRAFKRSYIFFSWYLIGVLFSLCIIEILKSTVSEARPHFMTSCSPNLTKEMCKQQWIHITYENCTNPLKLSHIKVLDTMKSFPSGHASLGFFTAVFLSIYTHERVKILWSDLLPLWLNFVWWVWALLCSASRIFDKKHHWWDVVCGAIIGLLISLTTVKCVCKNFLEREKCPNLEEKFAKEKVNPSSEGNGTLNAKSLPNPEVNETSIPQASVTRS